MKRCVKATRNHRVTTFKTFLNKLKKNTSHKKAQVPGELEPRRNYKNFRHKFRVTREKKMSCNKNEKKIDPNDNRFEQIEKKNFRATVKHTSHTEKNIRYRKIILCCKKKKCVS